MGMAREEMKRTAEELFTRTPWGELSSQAVGIREAWGAARAMEREFDEVSAKLRELVNTYREARLEFLLQRWAAAGVSWCGLCGRVVPAAELQPLYLSGSHSAGSCETRRTEDHREVKDACETCFADARERSGSHSLEGYWFWAFPAEEQEGRTRIRKFGEWVYLAGSFERVRFSYITDEIAREWRVPPDMYFKSWPRPELRVGRFEVDRWETPAVVTA